MTKEELRKVFRYKNGKLYWNRSGGGINKGDEAGCNSRGYRIINYNYTIHPAHRLIWIYHNGDYDRKFIIDHINHQPSDNRIENLRLVKQEHNCRNRRAHKNGAPIGVRYITKLRKYRAEITFNYKNIYLGLYRDIEDAIKARKKAEKQYGFHRNHGT
jgi:hypothetical protein